jgi:hypothetical protein
MKACSGFPWDEVKRDEILQNLMYFTHLESSRLRHDVSGPSLPS